MDHYLASTPLPVNLQRAFAYHEHPETLTRLIPPWKNMVVESTDVQHSGPFAYWQHDHHFDDSGPTSSVLWDSITYKLPWGNAGRLLGGRQARKKIESLFAYRHQITRDDLCLAAKYQTAPLKIAVSGVSGLVGRKLCLLLTLLGHQVIRLERSLDRVADSEQAIAPWASPEEAGKLSGVDAVVHLAGHPIAEKRWNDSIKNQIRDSRVELTSQLATTLASLPHPPKVLVCASAIGIYGDRGDEVLSESSEIGNGFLAEVADAWEKACQPAQRAGTRVANARLGVVLDPAGGALAKMLMPAKFCGGALGDGKQWYSWVAIDDVIGSIYHAICNDNVKGPFNVTAPVALTNREFAKTLGQVVGRWALFPAPAFALRLALGEMADALLLSSTHVVPDVLQRTGYEFRFSRLADALRYCLGKNRLQSIA